MPVNAPPDLATGSSRGPSLMAARLQLALDASQMGLWDWDLVTGELVWDERSAQMYGTTLAESTGAIGDVDARVHPDDLEHVRAALGGAIDSAGSVDVEFRVVWPDGSVHWLYGRGEALVDAEGTVVRLIGANLDVTAVRQAERERSADATRMAGLVQVARALGGAQTEEEVLEIVTGLGASSLGAQGAALCLLEDGGRQLRVMTTSYFDSAFRAEVAMLPSDIPLPAADAATTGASYYLRDAAAAAVAFPGSEEIYRRARTEGSAALPLSERGRVFGSLSVVFAEAHVWRQADCELLEAFASLTAQALDRVHAREAERLAAVATRRMSETLQRSLLTAPPEPDELQIAVRYRPALQQAQIGGDWYDAFLTPDGNTTVVIGDVAGHDRDAAAAMGQVRNILRGVAQIVGEPPAAVLSALDRALGGLQVESLATAVLCQLRQDDRQRATGERTLLWSNAGHPPPLLVHADGTAELLAQRPGPAARPAAGHAALRSRENAAGRDDAGAVHRRARRAAR